MSASIHGEFRLSSQSRRCTLTVNTDGKRMAPQTVELLSLYGAEFKDGVYRLQTNPETALAIACFVSDDLLSD